MPSSLPPAHARNATPAGRPYPAPISKARRNVELKARDPSPERSTAVCDSLGAERRGLLRQRDTYFRVARGRLKLREEAGAAPQLIAYQRPDRGEERESLFRLVELADGEELRAALADALGVEVVIAKERRLFIWEGVRIHLDEVVGLGSFIELEAPVAAIADLTTARERVRTLREAFDVADTDLIGASYCDLAADRLTAGVGPHGG